MHEIDEGIYEHMVFGALARPAMTMGVTLEFFLINAMISIFALIATSNLLYALIGLPIHLVGVAISKYDPCFFSIYWKYIDLPFASNFKLWGVKCYEPD
jgi:type IV secretion system protein VirB3